MPRKNPVPQPTNNKNQARRQAPASSAASMARAARSKANAAKAAPEDGEPNAEEEIFDDKDEVEEPSSAAGSEDWNEINLEEPLDLLDTTVVAMELSEDPVRLYLKEIGQINLLDADSEFLLDAEV